MKRDLPRGSLDRYPERWYFAGGAREHGAAQPIRTCEIPQWGGMIHTRLGAHVLKGCLGWRRTAGTGGRPLIAWGHVHPCQYACTICPGVIQDHDCRGRGHKRAVSHVMHINLEPRPLTTCAQPVLMLTQGARPGWWERVPSISLGLTPALPRSACRDMRCAAALVC